MIVMATIQATSEPPESEPVLVELVGAWVRLTLDDGIVITLPRDELRAAVQPAKSGWAA